MSVFNSPKIEVFVGATGSGKGVGINRRLAEIKPKRLLIYDPRDEYHQHAPAAHRLSEVLGAFKHAKGGPVRVRFVPGDDVDLEEAYGFLCRLAFQDQKLREDRGMPPEPLVFLGEELSDVTKPKLPDFSPASQDRAAVFLISKRGALEAVQQGRLADAIELCRREWASFPGAGYAGQGTRNLAWMQSAYQGAGGALA